MKLEFNSEDLKRLEMLDENELYYLNIILFDVTNKIKRLCMADEQLICRLVALTETAAKEISCRKRWSPKVSNGKYSTTDITYDTEEYRKWLRDNRQHLCDSFSYGDYLGQFSFGYSIIELIWR